MARRVPFQDVATAITCLEEDGGVILTAFASEDEVAAVSRDAAPFLHEIAKERESKGEPRGTVRCHRLFGRSETAREKWLQREVISDVLHHFLGTSSISYNDAERTEIKTGAILSASATLEISPGEKAQDLHRDDFIWQQTHAEPRRQYQKGSDVSLGILVPAVKTTFENGATAFVPKSHLWQHSRTPKADEVRYAEMDVGEAFVFLGSTVHGGGANNTASNRAVHGFFYCRSWMRPEENHFVWWHREEVLKWSISAQKQAGYVLDNPFLGHCNEVDPVTMIRPGVF